MDIPAGRATTRLKYRFGTLEQARSHVRDVEGRHLFFYRDDKLRMLPYAPVCLEFTFNEGAATRLLHGWAMDTLEGSGTWVEIQDTRPVESSREFSRTSRRMGCDLPVELRADGLIQTARLVDVSEGGARILGVEGFAAGRAVELRLLSPDRLTFRDLSFGEVAWARGLEIGVQFDAKDSVGRSAVTRLLRETAALWRRAWESVHPSFCCGSKGVVEPEPPRLRGSDDVTDKIAL